MRALRIRMIGKQDVNQQEYYFTTTHMPCLIDLNKAVIHFYPDEEEDGSGFGGELVVRHYDPRAKMNAMNKVYRRRRRSRVLVDSGEDSESDQSQDSTEGEEEE